MMDFKIAFAAIGIAAVLGVSAAVVSLAQSGQDAATRELQRISAKPDDTDIVATVNGEPILRHTIDVQAALALAGDVSDTVGRSTAGVSREDLLDRQIESVLLVQAAEKGGTRVTEDEVTLAINAGLVTPLTSKDTPEEMKRTGLAMLQAAGVPLGSAVNDPGVRDAYRNFLLIQRYAVAQGATGESLVAPLKAKATIVKHIDVLNAVH